MKTESSIKQSYSSTTVEPITDTEQIIKTICEWNGITQEEFKQIAGDYYQAGTYTNGTPFYLEGNDIVNPIGKYLTAVYDGKDVVFEKGKDKFFGKLRVRAEDTKYMLGDKVIDIPFRIRAENEDTGETIVIFPKSSDIKQKRMRNLYIVNQGWAERQRLEKEIMAKLIELAQVKSGNEIISTQGILEELQKSLKRSGIELEFLSEDIYLSIPRRKVRDTSKHDKEYWAPPIQISINFTDRTVKCRGYSSHGFGTPNSWGNPCWGNLENDIRHCLQDCGIKELVNFVISRAYGYNSADTGIEHDGRHPLGKLREYIWWLYDYRDAESTKREIEKMKEHLAEIKQDLDIDDWLSGSNELSNFISGIEKSNETSE